MSFNALDPEIMQDFLTESGELLEQVEGDLVSLEQSPTDPELLNKIFRALHTIKGSASFMALTSLVRVAHAAESALNAARNNAVRVDRSAMDLFLQAVDTIKIQMSQLGAGQTLVEPSEELVAGLTALGEGRSASAGATPAAGPTPAPSSPAANAQTPPAAASLETAERDLLLPENKRDLLEFLVADVDETLGKVSNLLEQLRQDAMREAAASALCDLSESLTKSVDFFEIEPMTRLARALHDFGAHAADLDHETAERCVPAAGTVASLLRSQIDAVRRGKLREQDLEPVIAALRDATDAENQSARNVAPQPSADVPKAAPAAATEAEITPAASAPPAIPAPAAASSSPREQAPAPRAAKGEPAPEAATGAAAAVEQTIRVEVGRLEQLMNLVGELVLQKNRILALGRQVVQERSLAQGLKESVILSAEGLDRVAADMQLAVMRTRMQPLDKLFGKYPRLIRDLARKTNKKIELVIEGGETEVDKSVIDELGDPLIHLLRNSADHGIEAPEDRVRAGKSESGTIRLVASHEGSHVRLLIMDDGKGLHREKIGAKAVERGLVKESELAGLSDREVFGFIMLPGFSTAEKVSDLSGRGVGMDVVKTNIEKLKGTIDLHSKPGEGTTIEIKIPLTVAILPAMMVGVGREIYAVPLTNILEIVKPEARYVSTIGERPVMRLRDTVIPLFNAAELFSLPPDASGNPVEVPFALVLSMGEKTVGLLVTRLIGQQEIVIKPLDDVEGSRRPGPVSGATVRDDGGVSLIVDVVELMRMGEGLRRSRTPDQQTESALQPTPSSRGAESPAAQASRRDRRPAPGREGKSPRP